MLTKKENHKNEEKNTKTTKTSASTHHKNSSCCPSTSNPNTTLSKQHDVQLHEKNSLKTRITIQYDVGYPNQMYIRGQGGNLSWNKGQPLKNIKSNEWVWETDAPLTNCEFKVLINDHVYENGNNHILNAGSNLSYTPHFY